MIDYTKRPAMTDRRQDRVRHLALHVDWPEIRRTSILGEIRHSLFSSYGGADRAELEIYSVITGPDGAEPEPVSRRNTPSDDGRVQHTVTSPPPPDTLVNALRSGMPGGSETIGIEVGALASGTSLVFVAVAWHGFDLAQLGSIDCRVTEPESDVTLTTFTFPQVDRAHNCRVLARLSADPIGRWAITPIGTTSTGRSLTEFVAATRRHL